MTNVVVLRYEKYVKLATNYRNGMTPEDGLK
jgi:hypothetical protein